MDGLRWLLLLFGLLVIAGVYIYSRRENKPAEEGDALPERLTPSLDANANANADNDERLEELPDATEALSTEPRAFGKLDDKAGAETGSDVRVDDVRSDDVQLDDVPQPVAEHQKIVTVRIVARETKAFAGDELILSMRGIGLRHGKFGIFHRYDGADEDRTVFSAASLVEPGSFDLKNIKDQEIPGISLFLVLPGPLECVQAFDMMLAAARTLTQSLGGELLDESGSTLSIQRERYLREEIIQFHHSTLVS